MMRRTLGSRRRTNHGELEVAMLTIDRLLIAGASLLLWFEPERIKPGTKLDAAPSEWLLRLKDHDQAYPSE